MDTTRINDLYLESYFHKDSVFRIHSRTTKFGMNADCDRLSNLPDDVIHKILAFLDATCAVRISTLSSRWRYIWTSLPHLNFADYHFHMLHKFFKFVERVLSRRNNQIQVYSVNLTLLGSNVTKAFVKRIYDIIFNYAMSHNVQKLSIACMSEAHILTPSTWDMVALTTLNLRDVILDDDKSVGLFSNFVSLKNLTLRHCRMGRPSNLNIRHPGLSNLTLANGYGPATVVAPQLKNLIIRNWERVHVTSAPNLTSFQCEGHYYPLQLPADLHLEKADLCIFRPYDVFSFSLDETSDNNAKACKIVCLLQQLHSVKFLTLNLESIEILCSSVELISHQPSPFANLKSLKIHRKTYFTQKQTQPKVTMCTEVMNYLLDGSPGATFTMVSPEPNTKPTICCSLATKQF